MALQTVNASVVNFHIRIEDSNRICLKAHCEEITGANRYKALAELSEKMAAVLMVLLWLFLVHKNVGDEQYVL